MADAVTTFLNLTNPEVGASSDSWGAKENADRVTVDAMLSTLITGLTLSTAGSSGTFGIAIGAAAGMVLSSAYTKTTSAWAVGTGNGGIDTGAVANSTWYHVWLIQRVDTGVVDILFSLSATSPTLPTNYTRSRRIGSILTDGSAHWLKFKQIGNEFLWAATVLDGNGLNSTTAATLQALTVPTGVSVIARIRVSGSCSAAVGQTFLVSSPQQNAEVPGTLVANQIISFPSGGVDSCEANVITNTSAQVYHSAQTNQTTNFLFISTFGWYDWRGQA